MPKFTDLDEILGDDKLVKLKGKTYRLPPDIPAELYLEINRFAEANPDATQYQFIEKLYEQMLELFQYGDPKIKSLPVTLTQLVQGVAHIYGDGSEEREERPPQRKTSGGATSSKSRKTR